MEEAMCLCACVCTCIPMGIQALARDALSSKILLLVFLFAVFLCNPKDTPPAYCLVFVARTHTYTLAHRTPKKKYNKIKIREDQTNGSAKAKGTCNPNNQMTTDARELRHRGHAGPLLR